MGFGGQLKDSNPFLKVVCIGLPGLKYIYIHTYIHMYVCMYVYIYTGCLVNFEVQLNNKYIFKYNYRHAICGTFLY